MNKQTKDLIVNYIQDTLHYGVSESAYEILSHLMKEDRELAASLCDTYENLVKRDNAYMLPSGQDNEGYEL